jgi:hypothetical protein
MQISRPLPILNDLQNYWPINGEKRDYVGQSDMISCVNATLAPDRFNNPQSALYLNNGYCKVPEDVYFNGGPFTITAWVKVMQTNNYARLLDFGNGLGYDNIVASLSYGTTSRPWFVIFSGSSWPGGVPAGSALVLDKWAHTSYVFDGSNTFIYLNATLISFRSVNFYPRNILRQNCFIGRSNWHSQGNDQDASAYFDDIKIYNRSLSLQEILQDMI